MSVLGLMVLRTLNKKKWEIFSHFFLFSTFILPQNGHFFKTGHFCKSPVLNMVESKVYENYIKS